MLKPSTMSSWKLPPETREIQLDEKWTFVGKKEKNCDPDSGTDAELGDRWDHTAVDPEHALLLKLVPGKRTELSSREVVEDVYHRTDGRRDVLYTSDEHAPYKTVIKEVYGSEVPAPRQPGPGRPPKPLIVLPEELVYATVKKTRKKGRVVKVQKTLVFGSQARLDAYIERSTASSTINTAFVERHNGTDRGQNARKGRKTYRFSKLPDVHDAVTFFVAYSYNFCWAVRTLRRADSPRRAPCTPAMSAGLADHVWTLEEWLSLPARPFKLS